MEQPNVAASLPKLMYIGKVRDGSSWRFPSHRNDEVSVMIFIANGKGVLKIDKQLHAVQAGDLLLYNNGVVHEECSSPACPLDMYYCGVAFPRADRSSIRFAPGDASIAIATREDADKLRSIFSILQEEFVRRKEGYEAICSSLLAAMIELVRRKAEELPPDCKKDPEALAVRILEYLDRHYLKHLALNDIARAFHMNAYYLAHVFKNKYDDSPINYMLTRRMEEAKRLLRHTDMKVLEIANFLGYENSNYFTNLFRKTMGLSPTQYKQEVRRERVNG